MHKLIRILLSAVFVKVLLITCKPDEVKSFDVQPDKLKTWEVYEIVLQASSSAENPYVEYLKEGASAYASAVFTGTAGEALNKKYKIPAFWDGNTIWKIRFAPTCPGTWEYETFSKDQGLSNKKGKIEVSNWSELDKKTNSTRRGFIQVNKKEPRSGRYFVYADGTPFLWIADTWWDWTNSQILFESFKDLADTRSVQGFNIGQLFFAGNGWEKESSLLDKTFQHPNIDQIRKVEKMIAYANSKGITVWIHPWWSRADIKTTIGEENMRRWMRYVIDRLHAYNVIWVLAGEYNMYNYGGFSLEFWNKLGELVKSEDPYDRIVSVHPTPPEWAGGADAPQWSTAETIHDQPWLDYNQSQSGHALSRNKLIPGIVKTAYEKQPIKPIVVTEAWYEFIIGNAPAKEIRFGAWSAFMSGAAGHSYGGGHIWLAYLPEKPSAGNSWPLDRSFTTNTCFYPGTLSIGFMSKYLNGIRWWELSPHPELIPNNTSNFCTANPGKEYLVYLPNGGSFKFDLTNTSVDDKFSFEWVDLNYNIIGNKSSVTGGKIIDLSSPDNLPGVINMKDWLVRIYRE
jgi:hypothetical protein